MNDSSKYNSFTAADIERYYNDKMPAAERHALEKAALDDPFLADALEGYAFTSTPVNDINAIKKELEEKSQSRKTIPFISRNYNWLQIAALFIVLVGAGWFLYTSNFFNKKEIAVAAPAKQKKAEAFSNKISDSVIVTKTDSQNSTQQNETLSSEVAVATEKTETHRTVQKRMVPKGQANEIAANKPTAFQAQARRFAQDEANKDSEVSFKMDSAYKNKNAVAFDSRMVSNDSAAIAGITSQTQQANDTVHLNVVMQPSKESLNEVVVVGFGAKKSASPKLNAKFEELEPAEGWTNFNDYVAQNLNEPEDIKEKKVSGDVELSFDINENGEAVNIKVEKSLCSKCDEEAVRLVKEGPKWKKKKTKKGKLIIHF
jgi:hypothetical protein